MRKSDVLHHFGTTVKVAAALGISQAAVSQWKSIIPVMAAHRLAEITNGTLTFDPRLYRRASARSKQIADALSISDG